jgi:hypothetical protein
MPILRAGSNPCCFRTTVRSTAGFRTYQIPSGYSTAVYAGDVVKFLTTGYIAKAAAGDQMRGVAVGFSWIEAATGLKLVRSYLPASTVTLGAADISVQVIDDPNVLFEAVFTNSTSVPAAADRGATFNLYDAGGSTSSGLSGEGIDYTSLLTTVQQFRFMDFVQRADNDTTSAYSRGLFMPLNHDFRLTSGI